MGCIPLLQHLPDGTPILVVGRGGGHGPPETPEGISAIRADNGKTLWSLELKGFMSTQTYPIVEGQALIFHKGDHLWVNATSGKITRQTSIVKDVTVRRWAPEGFTSKTETLKSGSRSITQQSNLRAGNFHYFRSYTRNYLGRVNIKTGRVEYLELPLQILREANKPELVLWNASHRPYLLVKQPKKKTNISYTSLRHNSIRNSRGHLVMGDKRAIQNGWGHTASPLPSVIGNKLFVPILSGLVFVIQANAPALNESAHLATNDLGPLGEAFTRSSVSTNGTPLFARTIKEVIAISEKPAR
jgi:hypothetical protein